MKRGRVTIDFLYAEERTDLERLVGYLEECMTYYYDVVVTLEEDR